MKQDAIIETRKIVREGLHVYTKHDQCIDRWPSCQVPVLASTKLLFGSRIIETESQLGIRQAGITAKGIK
jgi:hypothetical protein